MPLIPTVNYGYNNDSALNASEWLHGGVPPHKYGNAGSLRSYYERELRPSLGPTWRHRSLTKFGFIMNDGKYTFFDQQSCYGTLGSKWRQTKGFNTTGFKYLIDWTTSRRIIPNGYDFKGDPRPYDIQYVDWVLKRSPWADVFIYKDAKQVIRQGNLIDMEKWPCRWVIAGTASIRHLAEYPAFSERWHQLRKHMPEIEAYFFAHLIKRLSETPQSQYYKLWTFSTTLGHTPIVANRWLAEGVVNLFTPGYLPPQVATDKPFSQAPVYTGRDKYWYGAGPSAPTLSSNLIKMKAILGKPAYTIQSTTWANPHKAGWSWEQILEACRWYKETAFNKWAAHQQKESTE
jgi:hypothetical protein